MEFDKLLKKYNYNFPQKLIAQKPASPRDSARLLVYNRRLKKINFDQFSNLGKYIPKNAVLVFNQTKVWPARLLAHKKTGGKVELLFISHDKKLIKVLSNRHLHISSSLMLFHGREKALLLTAIKKTGQFYFLKPSFPMTQLPKILKKFGVTPLPPYIKTKAKGISDGFCQNRIICCRTDREFAFYKTTDV